MNVQRIERTELGYLIIERWLVEGKPSMTALITDSRLVLILFHIHRDLYTYLQNVYDICMKTTYMQNDYDLCTKTTYM
jgi:hypothetical protein